MNIEQFRAYVLAKPGATEDTPFGPDTLAFRVMGKIFALTGLDEPEFSVNLKCNPERAIQLREQHPDSIIPGYHMNKTHWNTVYGERGLPDSLLRDLADHSYQLIGDSLPKAQKEALRQLIAGG